MTRNVPYLGAVEHVVIVSKKDLALMSGMKDKKRLKY